MQPFLCFRLHGPLASWGDIAVGEKRPTSPNVSRSAALGIVGAALGIRRDDSDHWAELDRSLGFACRTDSPGALLVDYHTAQGPDERLLRARAKEARRGEGEWHRPATRADELAFRRDELSTLLSSRQYRADAAWTVALWSRGEGTSGRWTLEGIAGALRKPHFVPYLGRKSCPLDVPMEPQIVQADDPVTALRGAVFLSDALLGPALEAGRDNATVQWEDEWPGLAAAQTIRRRDRVSSRARWQFAEREEHQMNWNWQKGGDRVPEQG